MLFDPVFKLELAFLLGIIERINFTNRLFQSQTLQVQKVKLELICLYNKLAKLILLPEKVNTKFEELLKVNWSNKDIRGSWMMNSKDFLNYIATKADNRRMGILLNVFATE